jgi:hypothetical protein
VNDKEITDLIDEYLVTGSAAESRADVRYVVFEDNVREIIQLVITKTCKRMRDDIAGQKIAGFSLEQLEYIRLLYLQLGGSVQPTPNEIHRVFVKDDYLDLEDLLDKALSKIGKMMASNRDVPALYAHVLSALSVVRNKDAKL